MIAALTVTRSITEIQNLLVCDVCQKTINEPKVLPCSHSFCKACLEKKVTTQDGQNVDKERKKLDCPTCSSTITLKANEDVAGLPENEFITTLLTAVGPNRKQQACSNPLCKNESPITLCMECEMILCHECYMLHEIWPPMRCHTVLSISEIVSRDEQQEIGAETLSCTQHKDAIPKFSCETCKELICMKCVASVHTKPDHTCVGIHEIFKKQQDAVKLKCATINAMKLEGTKALEIVINKKATYKKTAEYIKVKHTAQKEEVIKTVTADISNIMNEKMTEIDSIYAPACEKLSVHAERISNYLQKVEKSLHHTNEVLKNLKLQNSMEAQKMIDDDIEMLQNERPQNLASFQVVIKNLESSVTVPSFYTILKRVTDKCLAAFIPDTVILENEGKLKEHLLSFLDNRETTLKLCYRASVHGWPDEQFHQRCDDKPGMVVLVKVGNWIFGGYTDQTWQGSGQYKRSNDSFLFSLRNPNNMQPFKCPIINGKNDHAIYCHPSYGPIFGGGHDLIIANNANTNQSSYSNLGNTYQAPARYQCGTEETQSLFAGSCSFTPTEIEIFY